MSDRTKNRLIIKGIVVVGLMILLLIPTFIINSLVNERQSRQREAFTEISDKIRTVP